MYVSHFELNVEVAGADEALKAVEGGALTSFADSGDSAGVANAVGSIMDLVGSSKHNFLYLFFFEQVQPFNA